MVWIRYTREYGYNTRKTVQRRVSFNIARRIAEIAITGRVNNEDIIRCTVWKGRQSNITIVDYANVLFASGRYGTQITRTSAGFPCVPKR